MGYVIIAIVVIALYVMFIMWFFQTAAPIVFQLGCVVMVITILVNYGIAVVAMTKPAVNPPDQPVGKEPAFRQYFFRKAFLDYRTILKASIGLDQLVWNWLTDKIRLLLNGPVWIATWPLGVTALLVAAAGALAGVIVHVALGIVHLLVVVLVCAVVLATGVFFWALESVFCLVSGIFVACPHAGCYRRITLPVYVCPKCAALHRRLVPGFYGTFRRRCACGAKLPTLYLFGRNRLPSQCPHAGCGRPLTAATGVISSLYFPVAGGPAAGKTSFLMACVSEMQRLSVTRRLRLGFPDDAHKRLFEACRSAFEHGSAVLKTAALAPDAFVVELKNAIDGSRLVHAYDAAGELFQSSDSLHGHEYYSYINGIVFVIDPLSLDRLQSEMRHSPDAAPTSSAPSSEAPQMVYDRMLEQLRRHLGAKGSVRRIPIAVVVTKSDAMGVGGRIDATTPVTSGRSRRSKSYGSVREWLSTNGAGNLVRNIESDFRHVQYFHCSALGRAPGPDRSAFKPQGVLAPLGWLLGRSRFHGLPGSPRLNFPGQAVRLGRRVAPTVAAAAMIAATIGCGYGLWTLAVRNFGVLEIRGPADAQYVVQDATGKVLLQTGRGLRLNLRRLWVTTPFASAYEAALVRGDTNPWLLLRTGRYQVHVMRNGSLSEVRPAEVSPGLRNVLDTNGPAGYGSWIVTSKPTARVIIDGNELGQTPLRIDRIPAGRHQLVLRANRRVTLYEYQATEPGALVTIHRELRRGTSETPFPISYTPRTSDTFIASPSSAKLPTRGAPVTVSGTESSAAGSAPDSTPSSMPPAGGSKQVGETHTTSLASLVGTPVTSDRVFVYVHRDFLGESQVLTSGRYDSEQFGIGNDQLSSLRVPMGWRVTLYEGPGFSGRTQVHKSDATFVGLEFNDVTSGIVVEGPGWLEDSPALLETSREGGEVLAGQRFEIRLFNVDDFETATLNGEQVASARYQQDVGFLDVTSRCRKGDNILVLRLQNVGEGYTWGFEVRVDGRIAWRDEQGVAGKRGALSNDKRRGNVRERVLTLRLQE